MRRLLHVLTILIGHDMLWRTVVACTLDARQDSASRPQAALVAASFQDSALFAVLSKLIVDGRVEMASQDVHGIHCDVVVLLSQLVVVRPNEGHALVAESVPMLAGLIKCLQADTDLVWNDVFLRNLYMTDTLEEPSFEASGYLRAVERIGMDVRLLAQLYLFDDEGPSRGQQLARKLASHESQLILNGIRHYFVLAMSRVAFAPEPSWLDADTHDALLQDHSRAVSTPSTSVPSTRSDNFDAARSTLNNANEIAADLLELVLSPDEIESCWEALNDDADEEQTMEQLEEDTEDVDALMHIDEVDPVPREIHIVVSDSDNESETQNDAM